MRIIAVINMLWRVDILVEIWFGGEMVSSWWRDDLKPRFYRLRERVHVVQRPSNSAPKGALDVHISRNYILNRCVLSFASTRRGRGKGGSWEF